ncbi:hypothetical protein WA026_018478, partial [Henosepilachna vigintioctopunctata]
SSEFINLEDQCVQLLGLSARLSAAELRPLTERLLILSRFSSLSVEVVMEIQYVLVQL